ncbi:unnamed protein product [Cuscuta epithymum]|uniref:non-specific serine/threonine protein kinase n=1 Tax=Cuscuta epithymum TaxID=186058 RepID=A0AAV0CS36_9ASTE|nr:unnamed protein product [Cuscuta epithymum]
MGQSSKKKKKKGKGRSLSRDQNYSLPGDNADLIAEEFTALSAIFQEDFNVVASESPPQIALKIRPYSKDVGNEDADMSALLCVRFVSGYPYKCPKLQIIPEKGLSKVDADNLLSLLNDQASSNAREGRVMIYNLVEAAQEFLSEILPKEHESAVHVSPEQTLQHSKGPFVFGFIDLFNGSGESWNWNLIMEGNNKLYSLEHTDTVESSKNELDAPASKVDKVVGPTIDPDIRRGSLHKSSRSLGILEEVSESESRSSGDLSRTLSSDQTIGKDVTMKNLFVEGNMSGSDDGSDYRGLESKSSESGGVSDSTIHEQPPGCLEKDLILAHLIRLACSAKGPLSDAMPGILSELLNLGFVSEQVRDLANQPTSVFNKTFSKAFQRHIASSKVSQFWKASSDLDVQNPLSSPSSRYLNDFEELQPLGHGGFGHVVLCKNKLDGRQYAVKKIRLKDKNPPLNDHILREVTTLSRLQHQHVVRYYQAWFETGVAGCSDAAMFGSVPSSSFSCKDASSSDAFGNENKLESTYLYIQMEYCPRTLKQLFESYNHFDKDFAWHLFRQIVEGLAHIHGQGIIHRDLTPNNIFFGARNDIKIGDFGLAKFLKLEQLDQEFDTAEILGTSVDGTGHIGTYFYTAPEIEQGWPKINEKADMYSLGVVFFELWYPFDTAMERHVILSNLTQKGELPPAWVNEFPDQASLLHRMMSPIPSKRPSATELLQHAFPPRMEYDLLDDMLRAIHTSDDTFVYDKIVSAVFNAERPNTKGHAEIDGRLIMSGNDTSSILFSDFETDNRDNVVEVAKEVFRRHCAKHLETIYMRMLGDDCLQSDRNAVKLLTHGGDMIELCQELRFPFVKWVIANQKSFFKRYEISYVYRRPIGHSPPNRYLQGDFDIVGGETALTEAEIIKVSMDIITHFFRAETCDIHLNHGDLLEAMWTWIGIKPEDRIKVAELLSVLGSLRPQTSERKRKWVETRRQLRQELNLAETVLNRLQTVGLRFCEVADQAIPRLRGALPADESTHKALNELSELFNYLRVWKMEKRVYVDVLMPPTESYHRNLFYQIYLRDNDSPGMEGTLLAIGGRYDHLFHKTMNSPGAVGTSVALETILRHVSLDTLPCRNDTGSKILVCSRGGGGLLVERMELVGELWEENIKAEFVPLRDPSLTEQYEYANEHDIKYLVIITDTGVSQKGSVKVRHLELRKEKEVEKEKLVKFLSEAMGVQFRNPSIWC